MVWIEIKNLLDKAGGVIGSFSFFDLLDILVVALVLYKAIQLIRETRAIQLVKGIILLGGLYALVSLLEMNAMKYIFEKVFNMGIIAIIVLFQPEFRNAIEHMGRSNIRFFGLFGKNYNKQQQRNQMEVSIQSVCKACESMSDKRVGALIVLERRSLLGDIVATGTLLDAKPSADLIRNIFYPKSPLHDGAMILRDGKVYAAGCILPLTANKEISRELGTRHRAALGISEESDALVVVVSEETGTISVAEAGKMERNLSADNLREWLYNGIHGEEEQPNAESASPVRFLKGVRRWKGKK